MKKELITIFLDNLYPKADDEAATAALDLCNKQFEENRDAYSDSDLIDLYDSACEYDIHWPQPLGWAMRGALQGNKYFEMMDKKKLVE